MKRRRACLGRSNQLVHQITQVPLVLRLVLKALAAHAHNVLLRIVARARELLELKLLLLRQAGDVGRAELHDDLPVTGVPLAHVRGVPEAQDLFPGGRLELLGQFCVSSASLSIHQRNLSIKRGTY